MSSYRLREPIPESADAALVEYPPLVRSLLFHRGITEREEAARFLAPDYERDTHDPFLMKDMEKAAERILRAIERNERTVSPNCSIGRPTIDGALPTRVSFGCLPTCTRISRSF